MYAENWVYAPSMIKTKRLLAVSQGPIVDIRAEESHSGSHAIRSRRRETAGGGALLVLGSHPIGAAVHLKNHEGVLSTGAPIRVSAVTADIACMYDTDAVKRAGSRSRLVSDWEDVETWANAVLTFTDGSKAVITASFAMLGGVRNSLEVYTTNAVFRSSMTPNNALMAFTPDAEAFGTEYLHEKVESRAGWNSASPDEDWVRGYPQEMQDFMECLAQGRQPVSGLQLARDVVDVIYAGYVSAEEGRRVVLGVD
jgi:predicted dehydrogenase